MHPLYGRNEILSLLKVRDGNRPPCMADVELARGGLVAFRLAEVPVERADVRHADDRPPYNVDSVQGAVIHQEHLVGLAHHGPPPDKDHERADWHEEPESLPEAVHDSADEPAH